MPELSRTASCQQGLAISVPAGTSHGHRPKPVGMARPLRANGMLGHEGQSRMAARYTVNFALSVLGTD